MMECSVHCDNVRTPFLRKGLDVSHMKAEPAVESFFMCKILRPPDIFFKSVKADSLNVLTASGEGAKIPAVPTAQIHDCSPPLVNIGKYLEGRANLLFKDS